MPEDTSPVCRSTSYIEFNIGLSYLSHAQRSSDNTNEGAHHEI